MAYNRFLYNEALYNAGREEIGALARSIISAHTGPHVQAVVGQDGGIALISDFVIQEGTVRKPPPCFNFPDLSARLQSVRFANLGANVFGQAFKDLPASLFPVGFIPDLPANIFALGQADLIATILGKLGEKDLPAIIQVTVANLGGTMLGIEAPSMAGKIFVQPPGNLGARIHAPLDLAASLFGINKGDLPAVIQPFAFADLPGSMLGIPAPNILAFLRAFTGAVKDLPSILSSREESDLPANIFGDRGDDDVGGNVTGDGGFKNIVAQVRSLFTGTPGDLAATIGIEFGVTFDLRATMNQIGADNLQGIIGANALGANDKFLPALLQAVNISDGMIGSITPNENFKFLGASIFSQHGEHDLNAFIRVSETFVTAIFTVVTLASRSLRAVIGGPECEGGTNTALLGASATAQNASDLGALIDSFIEKDLGAKINTADIIYAFDVIKFVFTPQRIRNTLFLACDTIGFKYTPFQGQNLGALISSQPIGVDLGASLVATFPLPRVTPSVSRITAADLRIDEDLNIQELRLQLEGVLLEYFYVNGTDDAFIKDFTETWKINVRSFRPIAANIFGEFAAARVCRLGSLESFETLDEAMRACISFVLGLNDQANMGASLTAKGGIGELSGALTPSNDFGNLGAVANRVFPSELLNAVIDASLGGFVEMSGIITGEASATATVGATICPSGQDKDLIATIIIDP